MSKTERHICYNPLPSASRHARNSDDIHVSGSHQGVPVTERLPGNCSPELEGWRNCIIIKIKLDFILHWV